MLSPRARPTGFEVMPILTGSSVFALIVCLHDIIYSCPDSHACRDFRNQEPKSHVTSSDIRVTVYPYISVIWP